MDISSYNIGHYYVKDDALPDDDEGRDARNASTSMLVSSSDDPNLLKVFTGSSCLLARPSLPRFFFSFFFFFFFFFLGVPFGLAVGRDATGFLNSVALTHAPATFTFPAGALRPEAEVPDLAPSVGAWGSELELDPAPWVKVWCSGEELGPALGDTDLLSTCKADSCSALASVEAGPDFLQEAWVPVDTDPGPPETQIE